MLLLRIADEVGIFLAVVVLPFGEQFVAVAIAQLAKKKVGAVLNGAVAQGIHLDCDWQAREGIVIFGTREHRSLIAEPPDVAEKSEDQQRAHADGDRELGASKAHLRESL